MIAFPSSCHRGPCTLSLLSDPMFDDAGGGGEMSGRGLLLNSMFSNVRRTRKGIFPVRINRDVHQGTIMRATLAFIICMLLVQHAFADSHALRAEEKECSEHMSDKRISSCFSALYIKVDQELNDQYSRLSNSIDAENRSNLVAAQRLWVKFREADCLFSEPRKENDHIVFSGHSICLTRRTLDRLEQLESYNVKKGCNGCAW